MDNQKFDAAVKKMARLTSDYRKANECKAEFSYEVGQKISEFARAYLKREILAAAEELVDAAENKCGVPNFNEVDE